MNKTDVVWHEEDEFEVMSDSDGWTLIFVMNHFKHRFWYEIKTPDNTYLDFMTEDIYEAIDKLNNEKKIYITLKLRIRSFIFTKNYYIIYI